ncbi:MAG: hypothetical protein AUI14_25085 [Actinobacteria bacterium 13_2_20CM_2_71_6]|nr:MAG: hypothetical protein AUI14_25085 [Actinobacteria bacterium 13_2_20CM_2_71_6]
MTSRDNNTANRHRTRAVIALFGMAAAAVVGLANGLASCAPHARPADPGHPVSMAQAQRLASVRLRAGPADGLVQAVPELVAVRLGRSGTADDPYPPPPANPPTDGWRVRRLSADGPAGSPFDSLFSLLFSMRSTGPDDTAALAATGARFLRRDLLTGVPVDVIAGPAALPSPAPVLIGPRPAARPSPSGLPFAADGGQVTYWLDDASRLRRLDALLRKDLPVRIDFARDDRTAPAAIGALGGAPIAPRPVTAAEAQLLARMPVHDRAARGGRVTVVLPVAPAGLLRGDGWLDWRGSVAYLAARNPDDPSQDSLVWADRTGVSTFSGTGTAVATGDTPPSPRATPSVVPTDPPPSRPPAGRWRASTWAQHDAQGSSDLDVLLGAALAATGTGPDSSHLRTRASWLRTDTLAGVRVTVYEIRGPAETGTEPGQGLLRYWLDGSGVLRRLEVRTGDHAFGYLDIALGPVPDLTPPK